MNKKGGVLTNVVAIILIISVLYVVFMFRLYDPTTIQNLTQQESSGFLESQSQGSGSARLTVVVVDKSTGQAVTDAGLYFQYIINENPKIQTGVSTGDGSFNFIGLVPGEEYTLNVNKVGYKEQIITDILPEAIHSTLNVELEKANGILENVQQ